MKRIDYFELNGNRITLCDRGEDCQTLPRYYVGGFVNLKCIGNGYLFLNSAKIAFNALKMKLNKRGESNNA